MTEKIPTQIPNTESREEAPKEEAEIIGDWHGVTLVKSTTDQTYFLVDLETGLMDLPDTYWGSKDGLLVVQKLKEGKKFVEVPSEDALKIDQEFAEFGEMVNVNGSVYKTYFEKLGS